jgi:PAS domain-containing protein
MKTGSPTHHNVDRATHEQKLKEIILQLPLGLICTDLDGKTLLINAPAKELLETNPLAEEHEKHEQEEQLPSLPPEIRRGIESFRDLLTQDARTYVKPFPRFSLQNWANYDLELFLYCPVEVLCHETRKQARIIVLFTDPDLKI